MKEWISKKENYLFVGAVVASLLVFLGLCGAVVTTKAISIAWNAEWEWWEVTKLASRAPLNIGEIIAQGAATPFFILYGMVLVAVVLTVLGQFVNKNFYIASTLLLLVTGVLFLIGNNLYVLALTTKLCGNPNAFEDAMGTAETKLAFGTTFSAMVCFASALVNFSAVSNKDEFKVSEMAEMGVLSAVAIGLQFINIKIGATGGSINLGLIPLFFIALRHGSVKGFIASGLVYGLVTCITDGYGLQTYPFDYLIGFGGCAVLGFFRNLCFTTEGKGWKPLGFVWIAVGVIAATVIRFFGSSVSSMVNYGYTFVPAAEYNLVYVSVTGAVSLAAMEALYIPMASLNKQFPTTTAKTASATPSENALED